MPGKKRNVKKNGNDYRRSPFKGASVDATQTVLNLRQDHFHGRTQRSRDNGGLQGLRDRVVLEVKERDGAAIIGPRGRHQEDGSPSAPARSWHERICDRIDRLEQWADKTIKEKMREIRALKK